MKVFSLTLALLAFLLGPQNLLANPKNPVSHSEHKEHWSCPMHPQVKSDKPGQCSICGMNLVQKMTDPAPKKKQMEHKDNWICPMHPQVKSDKPGQCSICGMNLVLKKEEAAKEQKKETAPKTEHHEKKN